MMGRLNAGTKEALFVMGVLTVALVVGIAVLAVWLSGEDGAEPAAVPAETAEAPPPAPPPAGGPFSRNLSLNPPRRSRLGADRGVGCVGGWWAAVWDAFGRLGGGGVPAGALSGGFRAAWDTAGGGGPRGGGGEAPEPGGVPGERLAAGASGGDDAASSGGGVWSAGRGG